MLEIGCYAAFKSDSGSPVLLSEEPDFNNTVWISNDYCSLLFVDDTCLHNFCARR